MKKKNFESKKNFRNTPNILNLGSQQHRNRNEDGNDNNQIENLRVRRKKKRKQRKRKKRKQKKKELEQKEVNGMLNNFNDNKKENEKGKSKGKEKEKEKEQTGKSQNTVLNNNANGNGNDNDNENGTNNNNNKNGNGNGNGNGQDSEALSSGQDDDLAINTSENKDSKEITSNEHVVRPDPAPNIQPFIFATKIQSNLNPITMDIIDKCKNRNEEIQLLGDRIHPLVLNKVNDNKKAGEITGLIVAMKPQDVIPLLSDDTKLASCIKRAEKELNKNNNNSNNNSGASITALQISQRVKNMKTSHQKAMSELLTNPDP